MSKRRQDLKERAFQLAARVLRLYSRIARIDEAFAFIARQLLRASARIGAQFEEGAAASSRKDMAEKYAIGLREARESNYWARLLATDSRTADLIAPIVQETSEFVAMLTVSVRKLRKPPEEPPTSDVDL